MSHKQILVEANALMAVGLRKAAIDILLDYLESKPDSPEVLAAVGKAYMLDSRSEKAASFLKQALAAKEGGETRGVADPCSERDYIDADDLAFIDSESRQLEEQEYNLDQENDSNWGANTHSWYRGHLGSVEDHSERHRQIAGSDREDSPRGEFREAFESAWEDVGVGETTEVDLQAAGVQVNESDPLGEEDIVSFDDAMDYSDHFDFDDELPDEISWDDYEDLDEFEEDASREGLEVFADETRISRETRAKQIAVEVLENAEWDSCHLGLLVQIFMENGWSAARRAIENLVQTGLLPEELALAREIRHFWAANEKYWITFENIKDNYRYRQTSARYGNMSWVESRRILNCFRSTPQIEEIYVLIEETYYHWYNATRLHGPFPSFLLYLKYRTGSMRNALSGGVSWFFLDCRDDYTGVDSDNLYNTNSKESQTLKELGVNLPQWPPLPENKIKIKEESFE